MSPLQNQVVSPLAPALIRCAVSVTVLVNTSTLTIINTTVKLGLPKIRPELLEHDLNGQIDDSITDSSRSRVIGPKTRFHECGTMRLEELEQIRRPDKCQLQDLAKSIGNIAPILRNDEGRVEQTRTRRIEGSNTVLVRLIRDTTAVIDSILHSHTGINNGKERGGHTDKWNTTSVKASRHAGNIKQDSATNREEGLTTTELVGTEVIEELIDGLSHQEEINGSNDVRKDQLAKTSE